MRNRYQKSMERERFQFILELLFERLNFSFLSYEMASYSFFLASVQHFSPLSSEILFARDPSWSTACHIRFLERKLCSLVSHITSSSYPWNVGRYSFGAKVVKFESWQFLHHQIFDNFESIGSLAQISPTRSLASGTAT